MRRAPVSPTHGRFRGPHNTGVPAGTVLTPAGVVDHSLADVTITDKSFYGPVTVTGARRIYRRCLFDIGALNANLNYALRTVSAPTGSDAPVFEDCEINGRNCIFALYGGPMIGRRLNVYGGVHPVQWGDQTVLEDSFCHDPEYTLGSHCDVSQLIGGSSGRASRCSFDGRVAPGKHEVSVNIQFGTFVSDTTSYLFEDCYFVGGQTVLNGSTAGIAGHVPTGGIVFDGCRIGPENDGGNNQIASAVRNGAAYSWIDCVDDVTGEAI